MAKNLNLFLNNLDRAIKKWCHMTSKKRKKEAIGKIQETKQIEGHRIW